MKAAFYYKNNDVRIEEVPVPQINDGEILVKTKSCGVCVADTMEWYLVNRAPLILGHEATGVIVKKGSKVKNFKEGDRVFVHHHVACMICEHCRRRNYTMCSTFKTTHYKPGGFAEYFVASAEHIRWDTLILPNEVSFEAGTLIEPLACVIHAIKRLGIMAKDSVAIIGAGSIGLMFIQALKAYGVRKIVAYEVIPWRKKKAEELNVNVFEPMQNTAQELDRLKDLLGTVGADKVLVIAKDLRAMEFGMEIANKGSTVLLFATPAPDEYMKFFISNAFFKELTVKLSYSADHLDTREALELIQYKKVNAESLITHKFPLERLSNAILQTAGRGESLKCVINFD